MPKTKPKARELDQEGLSALRGVDVSDIKIPDDLVENVRDLAKYEYPFRNLIFGGGGNRLFAYTGSLQVLQDVGILPNIKRLAGTSLGALTACFVALGLSPFQLLVEVEQARRKIQKMLLDARWGIFSLYSNLKADYGWHPASGYTKWLQENIEDYSGNGQLTFRQLYETTGIELCCVATNLNLMTAEYCHVKTTPDLPIIVALRMSMSLPALLCAVKYNLRGQEDIYVDGGLLCNFPIHVYDGWWLSMEEENTFFKRLRPAEDIHKLYSTKERFKEKNKETLGVCLFTESESSLMQIQFKERYHGKYAEVPDTKLARERKDIIQRTSTAAEASVALTTAFVKFFEVIEVYDKDNNGGLSIEEFKALVKCNTDEFTHEDYFTLFGKEDANTVFNNIDKNGNGVIHTKEILNYVESKGIHMMAEFIGYKRQEINGLGSYLTALQNSVFNQAMREFVEPSDVKRTVGVDSYYINGTDFAIEAEDRTFLFEQGYRATVAYLEEFVKSGKARRK
ncbi:uncharacterized protein LOC117120370 [Anneissia japonica]|uniref:uncharacterized protein LOC117120370 n=1 Tax=Anneissia japonica TaxID=1529436 RepID=UPI00142579D7|nr:uncharacterized protein LOC117120370 [Anneissia japonica]